MKWNRAFVKFLRNPFEAIYNLSKTGHPCQKPVSYAFSGIQTNVVGLDIGLEEAIELDGLELLYSPQNQNLECLKECLQYLGVSSESLLGLRNEAGSYWYLRYSIDFVSKVLETDFGLAHLYRQENGNYKYLVLKPEINGKTLLLFQNHFVVVKGIPQSYRSVNFTLKAKWINLIYGILTPELGFNPYWAKFSEAVDYETKKRFLRRALEEEGISDEAAVEQLMMVQETVSPVSSFSEDTPIVEETKEEEIIEADFETVEEEPFDFLKMFDLAMAATKESESYIMIKHPDPNVRAKGFYSKILVIIYSYDEGWCNYSRFNCKKLAQVYFETREAQDFQELINRSWDLKMTYEEVPQSLVAEEVLVEEDKRHLYQDVNENIALLDQSFVIEENILVVSDIPFDMVVSHFNCEKDGKILTIYHQPKVKINEEIANLLFTMKDKFPIRMLSQMLEGKWSIDPVIKVLNIDVLLDLKNPYLRFKINKSYMAHLILNEGQYISTDLIWRAYGALNDIYVNDLELSVANFALLTLLEEYPRIALNLSLEEVFKIKLKLEENLAEPIGPLFFRSRNKFFNKYGFRVDITDLIKVYKKSAFTLGGYLKVLGIDFVYEEGVLKCLDFPIHYKVNLNKRHFELGCEQSEIFEEENMLIKHHHSYYENLDPMFEKYYNNTSGGLSYLGYKNGFNFPLRRKDLKFTPSDFHEEIEQEKESPLPRKYLIDADLTCKLDFIRNHINKIQCEPWLSTSVRVS